VAAVNVPHRRARRDLDVVLVLGVALCLVVNLAPGLTAVRTVLGLPFLLAGVGYAMMAALYGDELPEGSMQLMLVPALSVCALILTALVLHVSRLGIDARSFADAALILVAITSVIASVRRRSGRFEPIPVPLGAALRSRWTWSVLVVAAVFAVLLAILARPLPNDQIAGYTALSSLRARGGAIAVAVRSEELHGVAYRLVVSPAGGRRETRAFTLAPGTAWARTLRLSGPPLQTVTVALYRASAPHAVYRQVTLRP
jgi:hypothetical protein